jgi:hypothetical protein
MNYCKVPIDILRVVEQLASIIDLEKKKVSNRKLLELCAGAGIGNLSNDPHLCHEIAEVALNHLIRTKYGKELLDSADPTAACSEILRPIQQRLPTQTWRSSAQITYQQFSTPAHIAYLAAYLLDLKSSDIVLEPSSGTGSLAVWASAAGATVVANEIDPRRCELARILGFDPAGHNAEFIDDLLPENVIPNVILANPPFSSSGGRTDRNEKKFGFRHVESALRRLSAGGRFAVILGVAGSPSSLAGRTFWLGLSDVRLSGAIELQGTEYYKNGTTGGVTLILGRKLSKLEDLEPTLIESLPIIFTSSVEDAFEKALGVNLRL